MMKAVLRGVVVLISATASLAFAAVPFQVEVKSTANPDGTVAITAKGNANWRGSITVRDEKGRLVAIVSQDAVKKFPVNEEIQFTWDGKDYDGKPLPAGRYSVRAEGLAVNPIGSYDPGFHIDYSYPVFDAMERAVFIGGTNYFEEGPWTADSTLPEYYCKKVDFNGFPLSPIMTYGTTVDIHDSLYASSAYWAIPRPFSRTKVDGRTGKMVWKLPNVMPADAQLKDWYPAERGNWSTFWPLKLVPAWPAGLWDTDDTVVYGGFTPYLFKADARSGRWLSPPLRSGLDAAWKQRLQIKSFGPLPNFALWKLSVAANGDILANPDYESVSPGSQLRIVRLRPDGSVIWVLSHPQTRPPRAPDFLGANYGKGTHDNASPSSDITGNVYRDGGNILVKFDKYGQLLMLASVFDEQPRNIGFMNISRDGHSVVLSEEHTWSLYVYQMDWAETIVNKTGEPAKEKIPDDLPDVKDPSFLTTQSTVVDWLNLGRWFLANKQYEKALPALEQVLKESKAPDYWAVALMNIARAYERQGFWEKQLETYQRLAGLVPREAGWVAFECACLEKAHGRAQAAIARLSSAVKQEKNPYLKAKMLLQLAGWQPDEEAIKTYKTVAETHCFARGHALSGLLNRLVQTKRWQEAEGIAKELITNYPWGRYPWSAQGISNRFWQRIQKELGKTTEPVPVLRIEGQSGTPGDSVADFVLGQDTIEKYTYPIADVPNHHYCYISEPNTFGWPYGLELQGGKLWIADSNKGRIVAYDLPITKNRPDESKVIGLKVPYGRPYWTWPVNPTGVGPKKGFQIPWGIATDGKRLYVSDHAFHRLLVLDSSVVKDTDYSPAEPLFVLGQQKDDDVGFNGKTIFEGGYDTPSAWSMYLPCAVSCDGRHLLVADSGNQRILIWNSLPTKTGQPADLVLGQKDFISAVRATSGASGLNWPRGVFSDGKRVFVADTMNHRVLIWKTFPAKAGQPADIVLGLPDFASEGNWPILADGRIGPDTMSYPTDVYFDGKSLYVCDSNNNRVMIWDALPTKNGQPCDRYLGMPGPGFGMVSQWRGPGRIQDTSGIAFPTCVRADEKAVYVTDTWFARILVFLK